MTDFEHYGYDVRDIFILNINTSNWKGEMMLDTLKPIFLGEGIRILRGE